MNRQERRRLEREIVKDFSDGNVQSMRKEYDQMLKDRDRQLVVKFLGVCMEALHLEYGFGEKRLARFGARVENLLDCINLDYVSFDDILDNLNIKE